MTELRVIEGGRGSDRPPALEVPPAHDLEAEAAVISAAICGDAASDLVKLLAPEDFYSEAHRRIFEAITRIIASARPIDSVVVASELRDMGRIEQVGGVAYIIEILNAAPVRLTYTEHARRVKDFAVRRQTQEAARRLAAECRVGTRATAELLTDAKATIETLSGALGALEGVHRADAIARDMMAEIDAKAMLAAAGAVGPSRPWHVAPLDALTAGMHNEVAILGARPGMGKTSLGCAIAERTCERSGQGAAIFSLETDRNMLLLRMCCARSRVAIPEARSGNMTPSQWSRFTEAVNDFSRLPLWIDATKALTVTELWARARRIQLDLRRLGKGLALVVVDYLQLLRAPRGGMKANEKVGENTRMLVAMADELKVSLLVLSQLNRDLERRTDKRPTLTDLRESGEIEQHARTVLLLYRDDYYRKKRAPRTYKPDGVVEVNLAKQNNGPEGLVMLRFEEAFARFDDAPDDGCPDLEPQETSSFQCGACGANSVHGFSCACGKTQTPGAFDGLIERGGAF